MADILLVEDDVTFSRLLDGFLKKHGHTVVARFDVASGIAALPQKAFQLMLLDYRLPDGIGFDVMAWAKENNLQAPAIIMTSFDDVRTAVKAIHLGAFDYITKPVNPDALLMIIDDVLNKAASKPSLQGSDMAGYVAGKSTQSKKLLEYIRLVAPTDMSVIIEGESGTGKEYVARSVHSLSKRAGKPFVAIDCGAMSKDLAASELFGHVKGAFTGALTNKKGYLEQADGGTLFLDEVGNLTYDIQVKLLRVLQERVVQPIGGQREIKVDIRIIAATNEDLLTAVQKGMFREDLYHRLNEFKIEVPPLCERDGDLDLFVQYFIQDANKQLGRYVKRLSPDVMDLFYRYDWPGNLRELKNVVRRMVLLTQGDEAEINSLPEEMVNAGKRLTKHAGSDLKAMNETNEKDLIVKVLQSVRFNKSKAARILHIDRKTLYLKIKKYEIE